MANANDKKPLAFSQDQIDQLAMILRALPHIKVTDEVADDRIKRITGLLKPEQKKAIDEAASSRKGKVTDGEYKDALRKDLAAIGASR
jgi:hypothetical protein